MGLHEKNAKETIQEAVNEAAEAPCTVDAAGVKNAGACDAREGCEFGGYANRAVVQQVIRQFVDKMKDSDEFRLYRETAAELALYPVWKSRVQELRKKNYQLQNADKDVDLYVALERLQEEYKDIYTNAVTASFLNAEVAVCRIIQQLNEELIDCLDFESVLDE